MSRENEKIRALAEALIKEQSTITLATAREKIAWAAPVYYVFVKSAFYFFSDPASRHILESLESGQAAAAVYAHATSWQGIRGLQMSGVIEPVSAGLEAVKAIRAYLAKFPFTREFFESDDSIDLTTFSKRFRVRLYRFRPSLIYYLDNSIKFGFREEVEI
jgi:uncharacterized protein YhbP (UPF0306 family)